jgi:Putative metallopeptidase
MKRLISAAAVACALVCLTAPAAMAQLVGNPLVEPRYLQPNAANLKPIYDRLRKRMVLEEFAQFMLPLRLPKKLIVQFDQCNAPTRLYKAGEPATVCYELVDAIEKVAAKGDAETREMVLAGTITQAVFHDAANAIFDILQIPVWGRREDAADRLAGFLMVEVGSDIAYHLVVGTAIFFQNSGKTWTGNQFADVNAPEGQRFFNFLCMAYGADPVRFGYLATSDDKKKEPILPKNRANRCNDEYTQVRSAFNLRIMPYVDPDLLIKLRAHPWTLSSSGR